MALFETAIPGAFVVEPDVNEDARGLFARTFDAAEFAARGLAAAFAQGSISWNRQRGTVRGLHYQAEPHGEEKLLRCTAGAVFDVIVDLRPGSPTLHRSFAVELSAANRRGLYVPRGVAHGFQTLADGSEIAYLISTPHRPAAARGVRWNDPAFAIPWPLAVSVIADRDRGYPDVAR